MNDGSYIRLFPLWKHQTYAYNVVQITDDGTNSTLAVDSDGGVGNFVTITTFHNVMGLTDEDQLITDEHLVTV